MKLSLPPGRCTIDLNYAITIMKTLDAVSKEVELITDKLDEPIDKNIKHAVVALRYSGFNTVASCGGHLDHGFPYPWVHIDYGNRKTNKLERKRLKNLLKQFYKRKSPAHPLLLQDFAGFSMQSVKWPRSARKRRVQVDIPDKKLLVEYRFEMDSFADFLISIADEES